MKSDPIVFIVDDDPDVCESLELLCTTVGLKTSCHTSAAAFLEAYDATQPGCLVLDVRMPGMSGLELQEQLASQAIRIPIIIITGHGEVPMAVRAMRNGAFDFIEKPFGDQTLLDRIQRAVQQDTRDRIKWEAQADVAARIARLTPRENEVMELVGGGMGNKDVAGKLGLSVKTVEVHRAAVMKKLRAENAAGLVRLVLGAQSALASRDSHVA